MNLADNEINIIAVIYYDGYHYADVYIKTDDGIAKYELCDTEFNSRPKGTPITKFLVDNRRGMRAIFTKSSYWSFS